MSERVLIVGNPQPTHIGGHLLTGSKEQPWQTALMDVNAACAGPRLLRTLCWRLCGHRPLRLQSYSEALVARCAAEKTTVVIATGLAPISSAALVTLRDRGVRLANYLTDDPWNPQHRAPWFMRGLGIYHDVFTPRRANVEDLKGLGSPQVHYLPFGYAPEIHHPPEPMNAQEQSRWRSDVLFIGGADRDRIAMAKVFANAGIGLSLWGGYWDRVSELKEFAHGHAGPEEFRKLVATASVNLCIVRKANRDGHSMRSFELAAVGGCMLVEDTTEHRELFGSDLETVAYFGDDNAMINQARHLLANSELSIRLAGAVRERIERGHHTYADRLAVMIRETSNPAIR